MKQLLWDRDCISIVQGLYLTWMQINEGMHNDYLYVVSVTDSQCLLSSM